MQPTWRVFLLSAVWLGFLGLAAADEPKPKFDRAALVALLEETRTKHDLPMLGAAVVTDQGLQLVASVGVRKRGTEIKVTDDDHVHLGSDTKAMTAWLIAYLIQNGKLTLDTTLEKIFPDLAKDWPETHRQITVAQLLTHHAGLPANFPGGWHSVTSEGEPHAQRQAMMTKFGTITMAGTPGEKFLYSNFGYTLLGAVAERVGGASWEAQLQEHLFGPLQMHPVGYGPMGTEGEILQPWQHSIQGTPVEPKPKHDNPPIIGPAGRAHCSLPTWAKFIAEVLRGVRGGPGLLSSATYAWMVDTPYKDVFYCQGGWSGKRRDAQGKGLVLAHDGSNGMNHCTALLLPDQNLAVLVATNQGGDAARKACAEVRNAVLKKWSGK